MERRYFFVINNAQIGPLDEAAVVRQVREGKISASTLAWREGIKDWTPAGTLPELPESIAGLFAAQPPPVPQSQQTPPPIPSAAGTPVAVPAGLSSLNQKAYRFVMWYFRPWFGRSNFVREYVLKHPDKSAPVMGVLIAVMAVAITVAFGMAASVGAGGNMAQQEQQQMQAAGAGVDWRAVNRAQQSAHAVSMDAIQDVYEYQRDSGDRRDETYRRANYDWYRDDD